LDTPIELKELIANTIGQIGGSRSIEILKELSKEGRVEIRRAAIKALGELRNTVALDLLGKIYNDKKEDKVIKAFAEEAIKKIIEGARTAYLNLKQRAEDILKGKE
jgi:HEAT repeat protein